MTTHADLRAARARTLSRRWFLQDCGVGMAGLALSSLLARDAKAKAAPTNPLAVKAPHFTPKAKRVIYMFMAGAPSHLELFDPKPELQKRDGQLPPAELLKDYRAAFINPKSALLGPKYKFAPHGRAGTEFSELIPHIGSIADAEMFVSSTAPCATSWPRPRPSTANTLSPAIAVNPLPTTTFIPTVENSSAEVFPEAGTATVCASCLPSETRVSVTVTEPPTGALTAME